MKLIFVFLLLSSLMITDCFSSTCVNGRGGGCELQCQDNNGTISCSCSSLGELKKDGKACFYKPRLFFGHGRSLVFVDQIQNGQVETVQWQNIFPLNTHVFALAQDYEEAQIFYSAWNVGANEWYVGFINIKERVLRTIITEKVQIRGVAYDISKREVYLSVQNGSILVIKNYDSTITRQIEQFAKVNRPQNIEIDTAASQMFVLDGETQEIIRIDMESKNKTILLKSTVEIMAITLDRVGEKIFWVAEQVTQDRIEMSNYDGSCRRLIQTVNSKRPFSLTYWNNQVYWSDVTDKYIFKTSIKTGVTANTRIGLQNPAYTVEYYGDTKNYIGEWSSWTLVPTEKGVYHRSCQKPVLPYIINASCLLPSYNKNKFKCNGPAKKIVAGPNDGSVKVTMPIIVGACAATICLLIIVVAIVLKCCRQKKTKNQPQQSNNNTGVPPSLPTRNFNNSIKHNEFDMYQSGIGHHYETIPRLQQQLKEKALDGDFYLMGRTYSTGSAITNAYFDPSQLVALPPENLTQEGACAVDTGDEAYSTWPEPAGRYVNIDDGSTENVTDPPPDDTYEIPATSGILADVNDKPTPPSVSDDQYLDLIRSNTVSSV